MRDLTSSQSSIQSKNQQNEEISTIHDFGQLLQCIGSHGPFQKFYLYFIVVPIAMILPVFPFIPLFVLYVPDHWCYVKGMEEFNQTQLDQWKQIHLPMEASPDGEMRYSQCQMYSNTNTSATAGLEIIDCPMGWSYDRTDFSQTIPSEFNWVCSKEYYSTTVFTIQSIGLVIGTPLFGMLADRFGRKPIFFISLFLLTIPILSTYFIEEYFIPVLILTFIGWTGYPMVNLIPGMILAEISNDEFRTWSYSLGWFVYIIGASATPIISYFGRDWFTIAMVSICPTLFMFLSYWFIPESPSWLISKGKTKQAAKILIKITQQNKTENKIKNVEELTKILDKIRQQQTQSGQTEQYEFWALFSKWGIAKNMILITLVWITNSLVYDAITYNSPNMSGNQFVNFFVLSIVEAPSCILAAFLLKKLGRRWTQTGAFCISAISGIAATVSILKMPQLSFIITISMFICRFGVNITTLVVSLQAAELLPTPLRSTGTSFATTAGAIASVLAPYLVFTAKYQLYIPYLVIGGSCGIGMIASAFIPETLNQRLPDTMEEAMNIGKGTKFWSLKQREYQQME